MEKVNNKNENPLTADLSHVSCPLSRSRALRARRSAFTMIEIVIVLVLMTLIGLVVLPNLFGKKRSNDLATTKQQLAAVLHEAQSRSISQVQGMSWGVHFSNAATGATYALFSGTYSPSTTVNQYVLPPDVQFSSSSVPSGGTFDLIFGQITGSPSASTSITVNLVAGGGSASVAVTSTTITVNGAGLISD